MRTKNELLDFFRKSDAPRKTFPPPKKKTKNLAPAAPFDKNNVWEVREKLFLTKKNMKAYIRWK